MPDNDNWNKLKGRPLEVDPSYMFMLVPSIIVLVLAFVLHHLEMSGVIYSPETLAAGEEWLPAVVSAAPFLMVFFGISLIWLRSRVDRKILRRPVAWVCLFFAFWGYYSLSRFALPLISDIFPSAQTAGWISNIVDYALWCAMAVAAVAADSFVQYRVIPQWTKRGQLVCLIVGLLLAAGNAAVILAEEELLYIPPSSSLPEQTEVSDVVAVSSDEEERNGDVQDDVEQAPSDIPSETAQREHPSNLWDLLKYAPQGFQNSVKADSGEFFVFASPLLLRWLGLLIVLGRASMRFAKES